MGDSADTARGKFPIGRALIALVVVSIFTPLVFFLPAVSQSPTDLWGFLMLPVAAIMFAWPGALTFLALGLPTLYVLFRLNRTGFLIFAIFGAVYTALPWIVLQIIQRPPRGKLLDFVPMFSVIGIVNGVLTRLVVFGYRRSRGRGEDL